MSSQSLSEYEPAACLSIPDKQFFVVEYPGRVKNIDKVLKTLGGQRGLNRAINENLVELRYRVNDPFCHPINGDIVPTANFLVKVTRRRKKQKKNDNDSNSHQRESDTTDESNIKYEVMGIISKTCRFRGMADFQYIVNANNPIRDFRKSLERFDVQEIENFDYKTENEKAKPLPNLPPPSFSRAECPMDYGYQQNTAVIKVLIQKDANQEPMLKLINRSRRYKFLAISVSFDTRNVPDKPPPDVTKYMQKLPHESRDQLFENRPIWTKLALQSNLTVDKKMIKKLLPLYAYWMVNGPWRDCWIRYGYDPRKDKDARFLQLLDIRNNRRPVRIERAKRVLRGQSDYVVDTIEESMIVNNEPENSTSLYKHVFDGKTKPRDVAVFQMCDIEDSLLKSLIESPDGVEEICQKSYGFYKRSHVEKMRKVLRRKVAALENGVILADDEFKDLLENDDDENDENDEIEDENDEIENEENMRLESNHNKSQNDQIETRHAERQSRQNNGEILRGDDDELYQFENLEEFENVVN
ncbi:483_t:CDS:10 [Ambispora gerdemannii]|uniref:483_t:CDS:1 n=1 Tax=Ambispora gerdemannii TaxID=144530 RepID=A0A9N8ZWE3_9GLOM|nr:483_t:CDS:10 [Ambispora gerdemannii]